MSSESGRKTPSELKAQAKMNLAQAAQTETYVSITEKNWRALIQSQQTQIDILSTMMSTMETLATWNDLSDMQQEQLDKLTSHAEETQQTLTEFQDTLQQQAEQIQMATSTLMENFQSQAGKASENYSQQLYSAEQTTKRSLKRMIWVSLIPTILLIIWELIRHIWLLT